MVKKSLTRLSMGSKIFTPADDAGGLAVSMKLSASAVRQGAVANNIGNAVSLLQSQDGALKVTGQVLQRISELRVLYNDLTKSTTEKANYDTEFTALQAQLTANGNEKFNGVSLFGSTAIGSVAVTEDGLTTVTVAARDISSTATGVGVLTSTSIGSLSSITVSQ